MIRGITSGPASGAALEVPPRLLHQQQQQQPQQPTTPGEDSPGGKAPPILPLTLQQHQELRQHQECQGRAVQQEACHKECQA